MVHGSDRIVTLCELVRLELNWIDSMPYILLAIPVSCIPYVACWLDMYLRARRDAKLTADEKDHEEAVLTAEATDDEDEREL